MWTRSSSWKKGNTSETNRKIFAWSKLKKIKAETGIALLAFLVSIYSVSSGEKQSKESDLNNKQQLDLTRKSVELSEKQFKEALKTNHEQVEISKRSYELTKQEFEENVKNYREQLEFSREHNRLSVRPKLEFEINKSGTFRVVGLTVKNKGLGPAIVIDQKVYFDGKLLSGWDALTFEISKQDLSFWKNVTPDWFNIKTITFLPGQAEDVYFITQENLNSLYNVRTCLDKISVEYQYLDIYSDTFKVCHNRGLIKSSL